MATRTGSDLDEEFKQTISQLKPYAKLLPHKSDDRRHAALWIKKLLSCTEQKKERNDYSKLLLDMLRQGILQEPFTSSPPTGMLKCVFPHMRASNEDFTTTFSEDNINGGLYRSAGLAGPTAASTPARSQLKTSRIPVRQYSSQQEISTHKVTRPFADSSRSARSVSVGNSSPPLLSSVGGASSEHRNTSLHHPSGVTLTKKQHPTVTTQQHHPIGATQQHHPNGIMMTQQHHPTGVMMTQQHHPTGVTMTQQHHPTGVMMTQQHHSAEGHQYHHTGVMMTQQHHPTGVMMTQANSVNSTKHNYESTHPSNSPDVSSERIQFEDSSLISSVELTDDSVDSDVSDVAALLQSKPQPRVPLPQSPAVPSLGSIASPMTAQTSFTSPEASGYKVTSPMKHDTSRSRLYTKEMEMRLKSAEVKYNEDKLQLHKRHEIAMKQVLDRKNEELEDSRADYRLQLQRLETLVKRHERREEQLERECKHLREQKEKQLLEWKNSNQQHKQNVQAEYDKKLEQMVRRYEKEKQQLQQSHSHQIQQLLDETGSRMSKLEQEYNSQAQESAQVIIELELKVQQLSKEAGLTSSTHSKLMQEKGVLETQCTRLQGNLEEAQDRILQLEEENKQMDHEWDMKLQRIRSQTEMTVKQLQQQLTAQEQESSKQLAQLNHQVSQLQQTMTDKEQIHQTQLSELESHYKQELLKQLREHGKAAQSTQAELEKKLLQSKQKQQKLQVALRDSQGQLEQLKQVQMMRSQQAERSLQEYKVEMERSTSQLFQQMKDELQNMEAELNQAKGQLDKNSKECKRQLEEERRLRNKEVSKLQLQYEQEKTELARDQQWQLESVKKEFQQDKEGAVTRLNGVIAEQKSQAKLQASQSSKEITSLETQVRNLQQQLDDVQAQSKQEMINIRRHMERDRKKTDQAHDAIITKLKSQLEQQRQLLQEEHQHEMDSVMEKTNSRLQQLEKEYAVRASQSSETIASLQQQMRQLQEASEKVRLSYEDQLSELAKRFDNEKESLKQHHMSQLKVLHKEVDTAQNNTRQLEERHHLLQLECNEKISRLKLHYEERVRGLLPASVKQEYEDTIGSLKTQVSLLSQRASLLQEELDRRIASTRSNRLATPHAVVSPASSSSISKFNSSSST